MKNLNVLSLLMILAVLFAVQPASAVVSVQNSQESATASVSKKELKKQQRMEKIMNKIQKKVAKMEKKMQKKGVDTTDPVNKWLWFAIFAWVAAVVFYILAALTAGAFWYLGYLASLAGTIFFVVWLLKMLEVM